MIRFKATGLTPMKLNWWKPTKEEWVPVLLDAHPQFWKQQVDPTTQRPWKRLSARYAQEKAEKYPGQPILRATGLMQDIAYIYTRGDQFLVRSTKYGAEHQFGINRLPARPWMGVPQVSLDKLQAIAWKHILSRKR